MPWYEQLAWFPLCAGATAVGLVLSWLAFRRRGAPAGIRATSWSLLPLVAYLTGVIPLLWDLGTTIVRWAVMLIINPMVWAGIVLAGVSVVGFVVSGTLRSRRRRRETTTSEKHPDGAELTQRKTPAAPAAASSSAEAPTGGEDDLADVEEILRRRGIS